jgi:hypothetical protein
MSLSTSVRRIAPLILNFGTRCKQLVNFLPSWIYTLEIIPSPPPKVRLVAPRSRSKSFKKDKKPSLLPEFESRTVHPAASRYIHYSSPVPKLQCVFNQSFLCLRYSLYVRSTVSSPETSLLCIISTWCDKQSKLYDGYRLCRSQKSLSKRACSKNF